MLRRLHRLLAGAHLAALRRPGGTLLLTLALTALLGTQVPRLRVLLSLGSLAERALPATRTGARLDAAFGTRHELGVIIAPERGGEALSPAQIEAIGDWVGRQKANPDVEHVVSPFGLRRLRARGPFLMPVPLVAMGEREEMDSLAASPWGGILTDPAGRDLGIELDLRDAPGGSRYGRFDPAAVGRIIASLDHELLGGGGMRAHLIGPAAFDYYSLEGIRRFRILNVVMLVLVMGLLRILLGSFRSGALAGIVLLVAACCVAGAMVLAGHPIDLLSTGLFLILAVAALEDFLFLSYLQLHQRVSWRRSFRVMILPSFLTSLTTVIGFWSLCLSDLAIVRRLGLWAGVGAALEWAVLFLVVPALMARHPSWRVWTDPRRAWHSGVPDRLAAGSIPRGLALALMAAFVLGAWGTFHLERNDAIPRLFGAGHPSRKSFEYLHVTRGYQGAVSVVLPRAADRATNQAVLAGLGALPGVARVLSPYDVLDDVLGGARLTPSECAERFPAAGAALRSFFSADGSVRAVLYLRSVELLPLEETLGAVRRACAEHRGYVAGELVTYAEFAGRIPATLYRSLGSCLFLVGLVVLLLVRAAGQPGAFHVLLASFWGVATMVTALWILRVPLNFLTCIFASVLVGLTGDNVIQYVLASPRGRLREGIRRRAGASILVSLVMALACLVFVGSAFVPSRRLGVLLAAGFVVALVGDLWLLRALLGEPGPADGAPPRTDPPGR